MRYRYHQVCCWSAAQGHGPSLDVNPGQTSIFYEAGAWNDLHGPTKDIQYNLCEQQEEFVDIKFHC